MPFDPYEHDGNSTVSRIRSGETLAREVIEALRGRIEAVEPALNATAELRLAGAAEDASHVSQAAPLCGLPIMMKDLGATYAGGIHTWGSQLFRDFSPDHDSALAHRLRKAGAVFLGRTRAAEFGILPTTEPYRRAPTRNPWNLGCTAGGSSGGAAAAVASGMVPVAHGNDGGGSLRVPAACCGVFAMKPTRARVSMGPDIGDVMNGLPVEGFISRTVRDSAALLDTVAGYVPGDPYCAPTIHGSYVDALSKRPRQLRIAVHYRGGTGTLHPDTRGAIESAAKRCEELGHIVEETREDFGFNHLTDAFVKVWAAGTASMIHGLAYVCRTPPNRAELEPMTQWLYDAGLQVSATDYLGAIANFQAVARRVAAFHDTYDVQLSAVTTRPAPPLGFLDDEPAGHGRLIAALAFVGETPLANLTGQPAMSVPLETSSQGMPIGVQFTGRFGGEATLFGLAAQLEAAFPWTANYTRLINLQEPRKP